MSQTNINIMFAGLDIAKASLQLHLAGQSHVLDNQAKGHQKLIKLLRAQPGAHVVCEPTGGYEQPVLHALHAAKLPDSLVEAGRVRHFAKARRRCRNWATSRPKPQRPWQAWPPITKTVAIKPESATFMADAKPCAARSICPP
jgi:transposase